jgi:glycosyltransferase involved in cell wall biosynthesis
VPQQPRVSIGMPIYNAESLLTRALDALLNQTYTDFELIISDNASTDTTWAICEAYARKDSRISLYRNETNYGYVYNFNRVLELAQGEYFMWAAHDDLWEPQFLAECVRNLDEHPEAILAFTGFKRIILYTEQATILNPHFSNEPQAYRRVIEYLNHEPANSILYGLYRRSMLENVGTMPGGYGADTLWLLRCVLQGSLVQSKSTLFTQYIADKRDIRTRLRQLTGHTNHTILTSLRLDMAFIRQLLALTLSAAPTLSIRLQLYGIAWRYIWKRLGWPFSLRLLIRYGSLLLPEGLYQRLLRPRTSS